MRRFVSPNDTVHVDHGAWLVRFFGDDGAELAETRRYVIGPTQVFVPALSRSASVEHGTLKENADG